MSEEVKRNPYTGMEMAPSNTGNGEVIKVEDLINKPQKDWEEFKPTDTLENADSELFGTYDALSQISNGKNETIKIEDFINRKPSYDESKPDDLSLKDDQLISDLTGILNM